ncbi:MAG: hypothetical protein DBP01_17365, partial [gamma proteobacterium symbiont of Ctena orbiculata]
TPGMVSGVQLFQPLPCHMGVDLSGGQVTVSQQQLYYAQISAVVQQMGGKLKVQAQIQGEQIRVTGKKRDDLQQAIALIRDADYGLPLQFQNFRD